MQKIDASKVSLWLGKSDKPELEEYAVRAIAVMYNTKDASVLEPLLADGVSYGSQHVTDTLDGKQAVMGYLDGKMETLRKTGDEFRVFAELGTYQGRCCLTVAQGQKEPPQAVVLLDVGENGIERIDMCGVVPRPTEVERTGEYPTSLDIQ